MRMVFCGNIGYEARQSDVENLFSQYGSDVHLEMKSGCAFVYFEDENDAENAIRDLNGHVPSEPVFRRRKLVVEWGKRDRGSHGGSGSNPIPNRTLFVTNFDPIRTHYRNIQGHFEPYGKILSVRIYPEYVFVHFETQENATKALECTHLSTLLDKVIRVEYASRRDDNEKSSCDDPSSPRPMSPDPARASPVYDRCDGPSNPRTMSPDPARASPVYDGCDGPSNPRAMSPDPARASPVYDGPSNPRAMSPDPARASPVYDGPSNPRAMSPDPARASPVYDGCDGPSNPRAMSPDPAPASPVRDTEVGHPYEGNDSDEEVVSSS